MTDHYSNIFMKHKPIFQHLFHFLKTLAREGNFEACFCCQLKPHYQPVMMLC